MADNKVQSFENHAQIVPMFHYVTLGILLLTFIGSCVNLTESWGDQARFYSASLLVTLTLGTLLAALYARSFALRAQDRAIRAEEQLRHYVMTGKLLDPRLTVKQIIGLRFAPNEELVALAQRAADQNLSTKDIKQAVKNWRPDAYRVRLRGCCLPLGGIHTDDGQQPGHGQQMMVVARDVLQLQPATRTMHVQVRLGDRAQAAAVDIRHKSQVQHHPVSTGV